MKSEARKSAHYARPRHVSSHELNVVSKNLATLAIETFQRLGQSGYESADQLAASVVGGGKMMEHSTAKDSSKNGCINRAYIAHDTGVHVGKGLV